MSDRLYALSIGLISGLMVAVVAALAHRASLGGFPVGIVGVVLMILAFVVFARTLCGRAGLLAGSLMMASVLLLFYISVPDQIIVPDLFGLILGSTVVLGSVIGMVWPQSGASHRSRYGDEHDSEPEAWLESARED